MQLLDNQFFARPIFGAQKSTVFMYSFRRFNHLRTAFCAYKNGAFTTRKIRVKLFRSSTNKSNLAAPSLGRAGERLLFPLLKQLSECSWYRCFELHWFVGHRVIERQEEGVQTKTMQWVVAIAVFHITTDRMAHIG